MYPQVVVRSTRLDQLEEWLRVCLADGALSKGVTGETDAVAASYRTQS